MVAWADVAPAPIPLAHKEGGQDSFAASGISSQITCFLGLFRATQWVAPTVFSRIDAFEV